MHLKDSQNTNTNATPSSSNFVEPDEKSTLDHDVKPRLRINRWAIAISVITVLGAGGILTWNLIHAKIPQSVASSSAPTTKAIDAVAALGRLEPHGEVIQVSAPEFSEGARVDKLLVQENDQVQAGQIIAILDRHDRLQAVLQQSKQQIEIARARLAQVQAGAKQGDIAAQRSQVERFQIEQANAVAAKRANVARLEAELTNAQLESHRYQRLYEEGAVSVSLRDSKQLLTDTVQQQLNEAQKELDLTVGTLQKQIQEAQNSLSSTAEVRPTDVQVAEAELQSAIAAEQKARTDLETAYVRAPQAGEILKVHTRAGETVGASGVVEMGQTREMDVVAEVYEDDLAKIQVGQQATIKSANNAFPGEFQGHVYQIIPLIGKKDILDTDPAADVDARVAEVKIRLNAAKKGLLAGLTNLKVEVAIQY